MVTHSSIQHSLRGCVNCRFYNPTSPVAPPPAVHLSAQIPTHSRSLTLLCGFNTAHHTDPFITKATCKRTKGTTVCQRVSTMTATSCYCCCFGSHPVLVFCVLHAHKIGPETEPVRLTFSHTYKLLPPLGC